MCHRFCHTWYTWYYIKWYEPYLVCAINFAIPDIPGIILSGLCHTWYVPYRFRLREGFVPFFQSCGNYFHGLISWPCFGSTNLNFSKTSQQNHKLADIQLNVCNSISKYILEIFDIQFNCLLLLESWPPTSPPWDDWRDWEQDLVSDCCWFCSTRKTFQGDKRKMAKLLLIK